jgi:hypothetical protein
LVSVVVHHHCGEFLKGMFVGRRPHGEPPLSLSLPSLFLKAFGLHGNPLRE